MKEHGNGDMGISAMVAPAVGPTLKWVFSRILGLAACLPLTFPLELLVMLLPLWFKETPFSKEQKFDLAGFLTVALGLFCLLLALSKGTDEGWTSAYIMSLLYVSIAGLVYLPFIEELNHGNPILDLRLFLDWNFTFSMIVTFIGTICLFGAIFMVPLFMEKSPRLYCNADQVLMFPS